MRLLRREKISYKQKINRHYSLETRCLKALTDEVLATKSGRLFHSGMVLGKKRGFVTVCAGSKNFKLLRMITAVTVLQ